MFKKHLHKCLLCVQANVLRMFYRRVQFSMHSKHKPQPHSEVQSGFGCSPVGSVFNMWLWLRFRGSRNQEQKM